MTSRDDQLTRRRLLAGLGYAALAAGCAPVTRIVQVPGKCPEYPPLAIEDVPSLRLEPPRRIVTPTETSDRSLTARAFETPRLRQGEVVAGLYSADTFAGQVAVSFDDMPKPGFTEVVLRRLGEAQIPATFFVVGRLVRRYPDLLKQIVDAGHTLGNHTYSHPSLVTLTPDEIAEQFDRTQDAVDRALGYHHPMPLMRPPYGLPYYGPARPKAVQKVSTAIAHQKGVCVLWTLGTKDTVVGCTADKVVKGLKHRFNVGTGGVMVFHPTRCAKRSLRPVFRMLKHKRLRIRTVQGFLEDKYGWPLQELAEWGPKLLAQGPTTAGR